MGLSVGGGGVDFIEDVDLSGGGDNGLGCGGARCYVRYRLPRVGREFWEKVPNSPQFFFNFCCDVFLISLERRSGECS